MAEKAEMKFLNLKLGVMIETIKEFNFMCDLLLFDVTFEQSRLFNFLIDFSVQDPPIVSAKVFFVCMSRIIKFYLDICRFTEIREEMIG